LARKIGDTSEEALSLSNAAASLRELGRFEDAWTFAARGLAIAQDDRFGYSWAAANAVAISSFISRPEIIAIYRRWLQGWLAAEAREDLVDPISRLDDVFIAAARALAFTELDALLHEHGDRLIEQTKQFWVFAENGKVVARIAEAEGRARAFEAAAGLLPRIAAFMQKLPPEKRDQTWLADMMTRFGEACKDPGLLRDVASLLTEDLDPSAPQSAVLLRALAAFDDAKDPATALARVDPDLATLIRRLRHLPDLPPLPPKKRARRSTKRSN
jgi:hypothetical protein